MQSVMWGAEIGFSMVRVVHLSGGAATAQILREEKKIEVGRVILSAAM